MRDTFFAWTVTPQHPGPLGVRFAGTEHPSKWDAEQRARRYEKAGNPCPLRKVTRSPKGTKYGEPYRVTV